MKERGQAFGQEQRWVAEARHGLAVFVGVCARARGRVTVVIGRLLCRDLSLGKGGLSFGSENCRESVDRSVDQSI